MTHPKAPLPPRAEPEQDHGIEEVDLDDGDASPTVIQQSPLARSANPARRLGPIPTPTNAMSVDELKAQAAESARGQGPTKQEAARPSFTPGPPRTSAKPPPPPAAASARPSVSPLGRAHTPAPPAPSPLPAVFAAPIPIVSPSVQPPPAHLFGPTPVPQPSPRPGPPPGGIASINLRADAAPATRTNAVHVVRSRAYSFVVDVRGNPIEVGSGRFARAYLGEERWLESKTDFRRAVVIKILQKGVVDEDRMRFQIEKELLERVQGHPNVITLYASGESDDPEFLPASIRDKVENDFVILERLDMSLEERLKGSRARGKRDDLLGCDMRERLFRALDYMIPVASAVEYAHIVRNICHRDIKPANILVGLPDPSLRGATIEVRLADFNVAKLRDDDVSFQVTRMKSVPGTLFFQSPEQETNVIELLVNVQQGSPEVEYFEDFYIHIAKNDAFALFNRNDQYQVLYADRAKKRIVLDRPYRDVSESNVRAKVQKSVGRAADIYSLGALFYYLISGAYANPKTLYDAFHKFIEYEQEGETNSIQAYLEHEYSVIQSLRTPKTDQGVHVAPADRFFTYKQYLDGNGDLIDPHVMRIIARCMIRNKPDSYCQAHDTDTRGITDLVADLVDLYALYGLHPGAAQMQLARRGQVVRGRHKLLSKLDRLGHRIRIAWFDLVALFRGLR